MDRDIEFFDDGTVDDLSMTNVKYVHLESLSDGCFMLIMENDKRHLHLNIFSRSGRAKVDAKIYEDYKV